MDIYPQDLGPKTCARVLQIRMALGGLVPSGKIAGVVSGKESTPTPLMPLSLAMIAKKALPDSGIWGIVGGLAGLFFTTLFSVGSPPPEDSVLLAGTLLGISGAALGFLTGVGRRSLVYRKEVNAEEISFVGKGNNEPLMPEYLVVIKTLIALRTLTDALTERNIRQALRSLGAAIEDLPPQPTEGVFGNTASLQADASRLVGEARSETDPAIAASLSRQSEALIRRADTVARTEALVRRNQILRDEVAAQLRAFQTSLAAAQINGTQAGGDFAALAESVAQVAQEANALADARAELEVALGLPHAVVGQGRTQAQTARR